MPIKEDLLQILCCPITKVPVRMLEPAELEQVNRQIATTKVANVGGETIEQPLEEGLITENGQTIYRVTANIPNMIPDEGIPVVTDLPLSDELPTGVTERVCRFP